MNWADGVPNLLIGLREGLEAGLVVSIVLAAVRKTAPAGDAGGRVSTAPVWLGVLGAVSLAGSFAAVLTFSAGLLSNRGQAAAGGLLSVLAVGLVTVMIFWMRKTAAGLAAQLRGEVARSAALGAGALTLTAFLAVGREGLETTLFLWTTARASGQTVTPLAGALAGLAAAVTLCWLLYRRAVRLNIGAFFTRTAFALIVIAAGVLAYGLGDLQEAGLLPGRAWTAFDLAGHVDPGSWWASLVTGITNLTPSMTVLQVTAWLAYLAVVIPAFIRAGRAAPAAGAAAGPGRWAVLAGRRTWAVAGVVVAVPALAAGVTVAALPPRAGQAGPVSVTVTRSSCAPEWAAARPRPGTRTFTVVNKSADAGEITLVTAGGAIAGEIETLGPATAAPLTATLGDGSYTFQCRLGGRPAVSSGAVQVTGAVGTAGAAAAGSRPAPAAVRPVSLADLAGPNRRYQAYAAAQLASLATAVTAIKADLRTAAGYRTASGETAGSPAASYAAARYPAARYRAAMDAARRDWLAAQLAWERVGASYNSFGDLGTAVDGLPLGLPAGVSDPAFTGLHRLEYGLFHGQSPATLQRAATRLAADLARVRAGLTGPDLAGNPADLPVRAHEILEDALRDHLSGMDDEGGAAAYPMTAADVTVSGKLIGYLAPLLDARQPGLAVRIERQLAALSSALGAARAPGGHWRGLTAVPPEVRERVDAATGAVLESLAPVPDLLEVPPGG